jgi:hypothetical protein
MKVDMKFAALGVTPNCTIYFLLTNINVLNIHEVVAAPQSKRGVRKYF